MAYTYSENKIDLIINKVSRSIYKQLQEKGDIGENEIYLITDPIIDAANDKIINVADPTDETDAANKRYVDQQALSVLQDALENGSNIYINGIKSELSVQNLTEDEYHALTPEERAISNMLYVVEYEDDNMYGERIRNVADPVDNQDAATKKYVDSQMSNVKVPTKTSQLYNDSGFLTKHQSLSNYYTKDEVDEIAGDYYTKDEVVEISGNLSQKSVVKLSVPENGIQENLSVLNIVKLTKSKYQQLESSGQILSSSLYVIEVEDNDVLFGGNAFTC